MQNRNNSGRALAILVAGVALLAVAIPTLIHLSRPVAFVAPVARGRALDAVPGSVNVLANREMELKSEISGRLISSELDLGLRINEGDFLAQIDPGDLQLEIERIESDYEAHKKRVAVGSQIALELATAREDLANLERLFKTGNTSEAELTRQSRHVKQIEQRYALEEVANQQVSEGYENTLKVKRRQLEKMTFTAPFDGDVAAVYANRGDLISGNAPIARLISTLRLVEAKISEENFANLRVGQKASVRFLGYGPQLYGASVSKVLPTADAQTQRYVVHLDVDLPSEKLVPGLTGEVSIVIDERDSDRIIPRRALRGNRVLVVKDGRVEERTVTSGYVGLNQVEILSGLETGEFVIIEELELFRDGDRVRPQEFSEQ